MSVEEKEEKPEEEEVIVEMIYAAKVDRIEGRTITLLIRGEGATDRYEPVDYEIHEDFDKSLEETMVYVGRELVDVRLVNNKIQDIWSH